MKNADIIEYAPCYARDFERLNIAWLEKYFVVEPYDAQVLGKPDEYIIRKGGVILLAQAAQGEIIGTVALMLHGEDIEITKMAVDERFQGQGIGKMLMQAAVDRARSMPHRKIFLLTSAKLATANAIYARFGMVNVPLEAGDTGTYQRADRRWEFPSAVAKNCA